MMRQIRALLHWKPKRRYVVVSGYHKQPTSTWQGWFHHLWWKHNILPLSPEAVFIISTALAPVGAKGEWIFLQGNLGHCDDILLRGKEYFMPGCPAMWMAGAWIAYASQCDMLYIEQDVLAFGDWLDRLYEDLGDKQAIFGKGQLHKGSSTSIFLIRWSYIPEWTKDYLGEGREDVYERLPERKWFRMAERKPEHYARLSFGFDTDRPLDMKQPVWYGQKFKRQEMLDLGKLGLISCDAMPETTLYSNHE